MSPKHIWLKSEYVLELHVLGAITFHSPEIPAEKEIVGMLRWLESSSAERESFFRDSPKAHHSLSKHITYRCCLLPLPPSLSLALPPTLLFPPLPHLSRVRHGDCRVGVRLISEFFSLLVARKNAFIWQPMYLSLIPAHGYARFVTSCW